MGMFDTLRVEIRIPGYSEIPTDQFQTKDFDCLLENYVITGNGELYKEVWDFERVEDDAWPLGMHYKKIEESYRRMYLTDYNGQVIFYKGEVQGKWRDYIATFKNGKLVSMSYSDSDI